MNPPGPGEVPSHRVRKGRCTPPARRTGPSANGGRRRPRGASPDRDHATLHSQETTPSGPSSKLAISLRSSRLAMVACDARPHSWFKQGHAATPPGTDVHPSRPVVGSSEAGSEVARVGPWHDRCRSPEARPACPSRSRGVEMPRPVAASGSVLGPVQDDATALGGPHVLQRYLYGARVDLDRLQLLERWNIIHSHPIHE